LKSHVHLHHVSELHKIFDLGPSHHPLVTVLDFGAVTEQVKPDTKISTDFYSIMFKNYCSNNVKYGRKSIDFQDGSLICMAPNQLIEMDNEVVERSDKMGWGLFFHTDLIRETALNEKIKSYSFFHYEVAEALHLSEKEKKILSECVQTINKELQENIDLYSQQIIVSTIETLLGYCSRFYGRQMITRSQSNQSILTQVQKILLDYYSENTQMKIGLPTVKYVADRVCLSPSYLSDLLKKETGKNTQEHIHFFILEEAKNNLLNTEKNINEIAYQLGFEYPPYFVKLFKQKTGKTPLEYRNLN
jgi:AraC-like DNA-binding protein